LFEDNAEFGFGIYLAYKARRRKIFDALTQLKPKLTPTQKKVAEEYLTNFESIDITNKLESKILEIAKEHKEQTILSESGAIVAQIVVALGGDGWAYDIGFGGLDHVLASGENFKVIVLDTEVYSNTGGQASKATQIGAVARFADGGKRAPKKRLGEMLMTYGNVFVAEIAMGANMNHTLNAIKEAFEYNGPAIIIAYATCINHGINMADGMRQMRLANEAGYLNLYTYNPSATPKFKLYSNPPSGKLKEYLESEIRYKSLKNRKPEVAEELFKQAEIAAQERFDRLKKL
jgi:pyruvate-ferredoxin/flavodoxin oxidoreductase